MAPTFLVSGDGHGFMNRYHTLMLKEIHKLPKLVLIVFQEMFQSWASVMVCGLTQGRQTGGGGVGGSQPPLNFFFLGGG